MEKKVVNIKEGVIQDIILRKDEVDVCFTDVNGENEEKLFLKDGETQMLTVNCGDVSNIKFGGTDNWGMDRLPINIGYQKDSVEYDSVFVDTITIQELAGEGNWCKCELSNDGKSVKYTALSENPSKEPRKAYFYHSTKDSVVKGPDYSFNYGRPVMETWPVTIIQAGNPAASAEDKEEPKDLGNLKYKVGLISDIHFDSNDSHNSQYAEDLKNALDFFIKENVLFVSSCGDYCQYDPKDYDMFKEYYNVYGWAKTYGKLRLLTAVGNHDSYMLTSARLIGSENKDIYIGKTKSAFNNFTGEGEFKDMNFFEYDGKWNEQRVGNRTNQSKLSYWIDVQGDIHVFMAVDYGTDPNYAWGQMTMAVNLLDYNNEYVKQMLAYVADTEYSSVDKAFDYQFYNPNTLIWLKDIIENNTGKRIFVYNHHFLPQKAGNGIYSKGRLYPHSDVPYINGNTVKANSNTVCGLTFYYLNKLNNLYKNVTFISGHSHWEWGAKVPNFVTKDYPIIRPNGKEGYTSNNVDSINEYWVDNLYCKASDTPKCSSGMNIHLPSLSKPKAFVNGEEKTLYTASEGGIMEVYENGVVIREIQFKADGESSYSNKEVGRVQF